MRRKWKAHFEDWLRLWSSNIYWTSNGRPYLLEVKIFIQSRLRSRETRIFYTLRLDVFAISRQISTRFLERTHIFLSSTSFPYEMCLFFSCSQSARIQMMRAYRSFHCKQFSFCQDLANSHMSQLSDVVVSNFTARVSHKLNEPVLSALVLSRDYNSVFLFVYVFGCCDVHLSAIVPRFAKFNFDSMQYENWWVIQWKRHDNTLLRPLLDQAFFFQFSSCANYVCSF